MRIGVWVDVLIVIIKREIIDGVVKLFLSSGHKRPLLMRYCSMEDTENIFNMQTRSTYFKLFSSRPQRELLVHPAQLANASHFRGAFYPEVKKLVPISTTRGSFGDLS